MLQIDIFLSKYLLVIICFIHLQKYLSFTIFFKKHNYEKDF